MPSPPVSNADTESTSAAAVWQCRPADDGPGLENEGREPKGSGREMMAIGRFVNRSIGEEQKAAEAKRRWGAGEQGRRGGPGDGESLRMESAKRNDSEKG